MKKEINHTQIVSTESESYRLSIEMIVDNCNISSTFLVDKEFKDLSKEKRKDTLKSIVSVFNKKLEALGKELLEE